MRRTASAAAVMAMTAALLPIPATLSPASAEPDEEGSAAPLVVDRITPDSVDEDSTLRVAGEVTNTTGETVEDVTVRMRYSRHPFTSRDELDDFATGEDWQPSASGPDEEFEGELEPDGTLEYSLSTPADDLGLTSYGVYPMVIEAVDGDGATLGSQYTFLPYTGDDDVPALDLAWVWPLMDSPQRADDDTFLDDGLHGSVGADGRLGRLLESGAQVPLSFEAGDEDLVEELGLEEDEEDPDESSPTAGEEVTAEESADSVSPEATEEGADGDEAPSDAPDEGDEGDEPPSRTEGIPVTWSVDPGTLDDILRMASADHEVLESALDDPAKEPGRRDQPADPAAQVWLREARSVLAADTVVASPYASADLVALLLNDMEGDAEASLRLGQESVARALELEADDRFAVPPGGLMDERVQDLYTEHGAQRFLLSEEGLPPASWVSTTPGAQAPLPASGDEAEGEEPYALVSDSGLTDVLSMPSWERGESALALQRFAAETAMIAGESGEGDRVVVAAPEPGWDPSPEFASGVLSATDDLPWLSPERLDRVELPDSKDREETRQDLDYPDDAYGDGLSSTYLGQVEDVSRDVRLFNSILVGDSDPFRPALVRLESVHWRDREALAGATRTLVVKSVQSRREDVRVIPGEPVTLASSTGTTGVLVANDLQDETVHVYLSLYSENSERLSVGEYTHHFEIDPGAKTTVYVPLSARINGSTNVHVSLQNADGEPISSQDTLIQVNATGLGTQALLISGIGLLILIAALAPRALRKWARKQTARAGAAETAAAGDGRQDGEGPAAETGGSAGSEAGEPRDASGAAATGETGAGSSEGAKEAGDTVPDASADEEPDDSVPADDGATDDTPPAKDDPDDSGAGK
ncbi:hypothetical protein BDW27_11161 [Nocardiopsis sp. L17-MgMaSL7]|nr:DUF6049 family protein [Nocardiopsis sp. L17-MgMaSL7]PWV47871.1 hypothetical protein BDW27_11161 [Nocardiopsis sp. L17-MgMaSL7]